MSFTRRVRLHVSILVIALTLVACGRSPTEPGPRGRNGNASDFDFTRELIAFESTRDGNRDIFLMTPDGSELVNITNDPAVDGDVAWSPDGSTLAFASNRDGNTEIYLMDVDGSNVTRITNHPAVDRFPAWSPDGTTIAFASDRDGRFEIYLMDADGSNPRRLTDHEADDVEPVWLSDGSKIVFCSSRSGNADIWSMNPDGTELVNLTDDPSSFDCAPSTVPAAAGAQERISFVSDRAEGNLSIYLMDLDGSNPWRVTVDPADDFDSSGTSDGTTLVFDSNRGGSWDIYAISVNGTDLRRLTTHEADDMNPAWRP